MNEEKQKILNIFDDKVKIQNPINQEKQDKIKELLIETIKIEGNNNDTKK